MKRINRRSHSDRGQVITEGSAAIVLILPLLMLMLFVTIEASKAWYIKQMLEHATRTAAQQLAEEYANEGSLNTTSGTPSAPAIVTTRATQNSIVFNNIRINNIVNASAQFNNPVWVIPGYGGTIQGTPASVTVTCIYAGGTNGLPPFPDWDPLKLGNNFKLMGMSTYYLENQ